MQKFYDEEKIPINGFSVLEFAECKGIPLPEECGLKHLHCADMKSFLSNFPEPVVNFLTSFFVSISTGNTGIIYGISLFVAFLIVFLTSFFRKTRLVGESLAVSAYILLSTKILFHYILALRLLLTFPRPSDIYKDQILTSKVSEIYSPALLFVEIVINFGMIYTVIIHRSKRIGGILEALLLLIPPILFVTTSVNPFIDFTLLLQSPKHEKQVLTSSGGPWRVLLYEPISYIVLYLVMLLVSRYWPNAF